MRIKMQGKIVKGIAGFYYVHVPGRGVYECKARGIFRKENQKPLVGDDVCLEELPEAGKGNITEILERRSELLRPSVANVDQAMVIFAIEKPQPNFNLLDRFLVMMGQQNLPCIICFNKLDLDERRQGEEYCRIYERCGYRSLAVSAKTGQGLEEVRALLTGHTSTVAGPSGVGKSSLINGLQTEVVMETGEISRKIERGRHTTRHSELIALGKDSYILDTPGFSSLYLPDMEKEALRPDCGVKRALAEGKLSPIRYENYCLLYEELKNRRKY